MTDDRVRAICYIRVSTDEQGRSGYSIPDQRRALAEHAERQDWRVVETVVDDGYSGGDPNRPGLRRVMELAEGGKIDAVLATKRDRFFRSRLYRLLTEQDLTEMGVRMVALNDTNNRLADGFMDDFAEYEKEQIRERSMRGLDERARSGKVIRGTFKPYGFDWSEDGTRLLIREEEMRVVVRMFRGLAEGRTGGSITREFEEEGVKSPGGLDRWNQRTIYNLLHGELYRPLSTREAALRVSSEAAASLDQGGVYGLWVYRKHETSARREWDGRKGEFVRRYKKKRRPKSEHVAVPVDVTGSGLTAALVDRAREQAADRSRKPSKNGGRYWALKSVLRCAECGSAISPHTVKRYLKDGSPGKDSHYYQCRQKYNDGPRDCDNIRSFPAAPLEESVWNAVHDLLRNPERAIKAYEEELERRRAGRGDPRKRERALVGKIAELDRRRRGYQDQQAEGLMTLPELRDRLGGLEKERKEAEAALAETRERRGDEDAVREVVDLIWSRQAQIRAGELARLRPEDRRRVLIGAMVKARIDREGNVSVTGMLDMDIAELLPPSGETEGPFRTEPAKPGKTGTPEHEGVVSLGSRHLRASE